MYVSGVKQAWENPDVDSKYKPKPSYSAETVKADPNIPAVDPVLPKIMRERHNQCNKQE